MSQRVVNLERRRCRQRRQPGGVKVFARRNPADGASAIVARVWRIVGLMLIALMMEVVWMRLIVMRLGQLSKNETSLMALVLDRVTRIALRRRRMVRLMTDAAQSIGLAHLSVVALT